jgi:hypothetical protein
MAIDHATETRSNEQKVTILAASNSNDSINLSDQNIFKLGTNRRSEILGKIGNTGQTYEKIYGDYIDSL